MVRLQRAWERAAAVLSSDPEQTMRVCAVALRDEKGLRTEAGRAAGRPSGKLEGKKLLRLLDELDALQRKAEAAQHAVVERERLRERARDFRAKKAAGTASDQIWINGRRPIGISELLEVRALVVRHLNRGRDREAARLCSTLLTTGETAMSAAGREGDRMRSFLRACRTEAYDNMRAKGVIPAQREGAPGKPGQGQPGGQSATAMVSSQRQGLAPQLGAFAKRAARYVQAKQMIESDSRLAVKLCDAALRELKRMPSSKGKRQARARWINLRDQAVSRRKQERFNASSDSRERKPS
ncbi:hypothetical protein [Nocardiopsis valliformis]|uniref:hypothetical protein n=1 Tax=Nocardiopsis valliformis TaxID=239974 RepID=UPI0012681691|nr:hypothetical protein [Nocardiopsis valliformis]